MSTLIIISLCGIITCSISLFCSINYKKQLQKNILDNTRIKENAPKLDKSESYRGGFRASDGTEVYYKIAYMFGIFLWIDIDKCYRLQLVDKSYHTSFFHHIEIYSAYYWTEKPNKKEIFQLYWEHYSLVFLFIFGISLLCSIADTLWPKEKKDEIDIMIEKYNLR